MDSSHPDLKPERPSADLSTLAREACLWADSQGISSSEGSNAKPIRAAISLYPCPIPQNFLQQAQNIQRYVNDQFQCPALLGDEFLIMFRNAMKKVFNCCPPDLSTIEAIYCALAKARANGGRDPQVWSLMLSQSDFSIYEQTTHERTSKILRHTKSDAISAFAVFSTLTARMHCYLQSRPNSGFPSHIPLKSIPDNRTISSVVAGLAAAHNLYKVEDSKILFVIRPPEQNDFDYSPVQIALERPPHGIKVIRKTFDQLRAVFDKETESGSSPSQDLIVDSSRISVIYYLTGNREKDYSGPNGVGRHHFATRIRLEFTNAIKCPTIPVQAAAASIPLHIFDDMKDETLGKLIPSATADGLRMLHTAWQPTEASAVRNLGGFLAAGSGVVDNVEATNTLRTFGWSLFEKTTMLEQQAEGWGVISSVDVPNGYTALDSLYFPQDNQLSSLTRYSGN